MKVIVLVIDQAIDNCLLLLYHTVLFSLDYPHQFNINYTTNLRKYIQLKLHNCFAYFNQKINPWRMVFYFFILLLRLLSY